MNKAENRKLWKIRAAVSNIGNLYDNDRNPDRAGSIHEAVALSVGMIDEMLYKKSSPQGPLPWEGLLAAVLDWIKKWDAHTGSADLSPEGKKVKEILSRFPERGGL